MCLQGLAVSFARMDQSSTCFSDLPDVCVTRSPPMLQLGAISLLLSMPSCMFTDLRPCPPCRSGNPTQCSSFKDWGQVG